MTIKFELKKTFFLHIPKTGGTTLDSILSDHYEPKLSLKNIQSESDVLKFKELSQSGKKLYITGHIPIGLLNKQNIQRKITIIRNPLEITASILSFTEKTGYRYDINTLKNSHFYQLYFSSDFDLERFLLDKQYGIATSYIPYHSACDIETAIKEIKNFQYILDFEHLELEIKKLIINEKLFPYSKLPKKRQYSKLLNIENARKITSSFDRDFYIEIKKSITPPSSNIEYDYYEYRKSYCHKNGFKLLPKQSKILDLSMPVGYGWNDVEISDQGKFFRWSEKENTTIEIPLAYSGRYSIYVYIGESHRAKKIHAKIINVHEFINIEKKISSPTEKLTLIELSVVLSSPQWIDIDIDIDIDIPVIAKKDMDDDRAIGITLGDIYIYRHL